MFLNKSTRFTPHPRQEKYIWCDSCEKNTCIHEKYTVFAAVYGGCSELASNQWQDFALGESERRLIKGHRPSLRRSQNVAETFFASLKLLIILLIMSQALSL